MKMIYTVEYDVDLGVHIRGVFDSKEKAQQLCDRLESERIKYLVDNEARLGRDIAEWLMSPQHHVEEYEMNKEVTNEP